MFIHQILQPILDRINLSGNLNAFCINGELYTFKQFGENILKIRGILRQESLKGKQIGLVANDDIETYASILAIWLEGLAYVPLHPHQPIDRTDDIISQADIKTILNSDHSVNISRPVIFTKNLINSELIQKPTNVADKEIAYILFTSGSTGKPKGVPITRKNLAAFVKSFKNVGFQITSNDRCLQCFDLTFDVSVQAFLMPLIYGACVYTIPHDQIKYCYVYSLFDKHKLTFSVLAPSMLRFLRPYFEELELTSMRYCILTAEASPVDLIMEWMNCIPNSEIYNLYGPTETTIYCTLFKINRESDIKHLNGLCCIGKPLKGIKAIICDEYFKNLNQNSKGELCIAGNQLACGYWKNPEKTNESFFNLEYKGKNRRFYRTGDLCMIDKDGDILYAGRLDYQVKIQGYRVELTEIEFHARVYLNGGNAVAVPCQNCNGNYELALFAECREGDVNKLIEFLKSKLPYYMIPTKVLPVTEFPLNQNGKIDRKLMMAQVN